MKPPTRGFQTPPEIIRYFDEKSLRPAFSWQDVWGEEHAYAFTVAKAVDLELLTLFRTSIKDAIARGEGFDSWREKLLPELQRLGWVGKRKVDDPTGGWKSKLVDFSSPPRLENIFWSNVRSARAAGQWERIQRTKDGLPYLVYVRTASQNPREKHLVFVGIILPVDDVFWSSHFPPNGWHCKCAVRQITRGQYERLKDQDGYSIEAPMIETKPFVNRRTGEIVHVPVGIDPGWQTNPGLSRARTLVENVVARLDAAGEGAARRHIAEIVRSPATRVVMGIDDRLKLPVAVSERVASELGARSPIVMATNDVIAKKTGKPRVDVRLDDFVSMQDYLDRGEVVDESQPGKRTILVEDDGRLLKIVVQISAGGYLRIATIFTTSRGREARRWKARRGGRDSP